MPKTPATGKKIAYAIGAYPDLTKTFIDREVLELRRIGFDVALVAIGRPRSGAFSPQMADIMSEIRYLRPSSVRQLAAAHGFFALRHPGRYLSALIYMMTRRHPTWLARVKTLAHFAEGVLAARILRGTGITHIHAHFADRATVIAMVVSRLLAVPYSLTAHAFDIYRSPVFLAEKIRNAKFTITCTSYNKAYIEREVGHPVEVIYHGLDFAALGCTTAEAQPTTPPLLLSIGRLQEKKGFAYLISACARLRERGHVFRCEIVGQGPAHAQLAALIHELGVDDIVTLCGALPHATVLARYAAAAVFALPCVVADNGDRDGIPNVILEAMAFGVPVVSTDVSGIPEVVRDKETGLLVESRSAEALSDAIGRLLAAPEEAAALGRNAASFVREHFDIRRNVGRLIELLAD